jgi:hypothetical protein
MAYFNTNRTLHREGTDIDFKTINRSVSTPGATSYQQTGLGQLSSGTLEYKTQKIVRWQVTNTNTTGGPIRYYAAIVTPVNTNTQPTGEQNIIRGILVNPMETIVIAKEEQPIYLYVGDLKDLAGATGLKATYCYQEWTES